MRPKATNTTVIYRHISFYTPRPRAQRVAPTSPVFQRVQPNLRSYTPIFYRLFLAFSTFNRIIFFSNSHKKPRSARCLLKIPMGDVRGGRPLKDTARRGLTATHPCATAHPRSRTHPRRRRPPARTPPTRRCHLRRGEVTAPAALPSHKPKERIGDTVCRSIYTLML